MKGKLESDEYWKDQLISKINDLKHSNYAKLGKEVNRKLEEFGVEDEELYYLPHNDLVAISKELINRLSLEDCTTLFEIIDYVEKAESFERFSDDLIRKEINRYVESAKKEWLESLEDNDE